MPLSRRFVLGEEFPAGRPRLPGEHDGTGAAASARPARREVTPAGPHGRLSVRRISQLHRVLGALERDIHQRADPARSVEYQMRLADIESAVRGIKVARPFEFDLLLLRMHLGMAQEAVARMGAGN